MYIGIQVGDGAPKVVGQGGPGRTTLLRRTMGGPDPGDKGQRFGIDLSCRVTWHPGEAIW